VATIMAAWARSQTSVMVVAMASCAVGWTSTSPQVSDRTVIPFDFGWRWTLGAGVPPTPPPTPIGGCKFPHNLTGVQCLGLSRVMSATTAATCAQAACDAGAEAWQLCRHFPGECQAPCFVGSAASCTSKNDRFVGGGRDQPPTAVSEQQSPSRHRRFLAHGDGGRSSAAIHKSVQCIATFTAT